MTARKPSPQLFEPDYTVPPGEVLLELLTERALSQAELARRTGLSTKHINQIISGSAPISPETALKLERVTGVSALLWTNLQAMHQISASREAETAALERDVDWLQAFPINELIERNHLRIDKNAPQLDKLRALLSFFGVADRSAWRAVWDVPTAYRKSRAFESDSHALYAWLRIGELEAESVSCGPFNRAKFRQVLQRARGLTRITNPSEWSPHLIGWCREAGVVVVFEPELPKARIIGAVRWLAVPNQQADKALVQFSLRHSWADIFWFTFFHEAGHLLLHDRKRLTLMDERDEDKLTFIEAGSSDNTLEREADDFASRTLIPREFEPRLVSLKTEREVQELADELGIAPGIVVGRLQHEGILQHHQMNHLRPRFKWVE